MTPPTDIASARLNRARRYATGLKAAGCSPDLCHYLDWDQVARAFGDKNPPSEQTRALIETFLAWNGSPGTQSAPLEQDSGSRSNLDWGQPA